MSDEIENVAKATEAVAKATEAGAKALGQIVTVVSPGDIPICQTRIIRERHGMPWNERVAVHPREDGIEIKPVRAR